MAVIALGFAVWYAPRLALLWFGPIAWAVSYGDTLLPTMWRIVAVASVGVFLMLVFRGRRVPSGGLQMQPGGSRPFEDSFAHRGERTGWLMVAGGLVVALDD